MKFYGIVGYCETVEETGDREGNWVDSNIIERKYYGDILRNTRRWDNGKNDSINDELNINNSFSIVADAYAYEHFFAMKYVKWMGSYWKITNVEVQRPRLILTIGGVYNGPTAATSSDAEESVCCQ